MVEDGSSTVAAKGKKLILVGIPAYNEEKTIARVVLHSQRYADKVIVCDDGSTDLTGVIAGRLGAEIVKHGKNLGKGAALRSLLDAGRRMGADVMVTLDADGQHLPDEIPKLLKPILNKEADLVIGCRSMTGDSVPLRRRLGNRVLNFLTNWAVRNGNGNGNHNSSQNGSGNGRFNDTQSGFRAYSKSALATIDVTENGLAADSQIFLDAAEKNLRILEVPVSTNYPKGIRTSKKNSVNHGIEVVVSLLELISERRPLVFLGIPGLVLFTLGGVSFTIVLKTFNETGGFAIGTALLGVVSTLFGTLLLFGAVILWVLGNRLSRLENRLSSHHS